MKRLLCIISSMNTGGAETFLMKLYRNIDRTKYQFDFCINVPEKCFYEDEILSLGGKVFRIPSKSQNTKAFKSQLSQLIKTEKYEYVLRVTSNAMGFWDLKIAKKAGAKVCCARSSNSSDGDGWKTKIAHRIGRLLYSRYVDVAFAPSDLAAEYTFGRKAYQNGFVHLLNNAVDLDVFQYSITEREEIRKEFHIPSDKLVFGHIGRFSEQKNHKFLLEVFSEIKNKHQDSVLLLVGDGPLKNSFWERVKELGLEDSVILAGVRPDVSKMLSAMDCFVFPSFYEGMPNTVIEAQATGLPCVISDTITSKADITGLVEYVSLEQSSKQWACLALEKAKMERLNTKQAFLKHKYDIKSSAEALVDVIFC